MLVVRRPSAAGPPRLHRRRAPRRGERLFVERPLRCAWLRGRPGYDLVGAVVTGLPRPGETVLLTDAASVQFAGDRAFALRVTRVQPWPTYHGWVWLSGYQLDRTGRADCQRTVFVQVHGLQRVGRAPVVPRPRAAPPV